jgi:hypothetical protein
MRNFLLTSVAAATLAAVPTALLAQNTMPQSSNAAGQQTDVGTDDVSAETPSAPGTETTGMADAGKPSLTPEQQSQYDAWSADQKTDYEAWPNDYKVYYWSLNADQQKGYWALTGDQRGQIYKMTPEQQQIVWKSVAEQLAGASPTTPAGQANPPGEGMPTAGVPDPKMAAQTARPAMPADESYQGGPYKGALTPPPVTAMNKEYPKCSKEMQDNCRNSGGV